MDATKKKSEKDRKRSTIGRRTGIDIVASKRIKLQFDGLEDYHGYWTSSENSSSCGTTPEKLIHSSPKVSNVQRLSSVIKDLTINVNNDLNRHETLNEESNSTNLENGIIDRSNNQFPDEMVTPGNSIAKNNSPALKELSVKRKRYVKGRRTGVDMFRDKKININNGVENYEDYWTDSHSTVTTLNHDKTCRVTQSYVDDLISSSLQRKSSLLTANEIVQTRPNSDTYQLDYMDPNSTPESHTLRKSKNVSRTKSNFVTSESGKSTEKNVLLSMNDNSDNNDQSDDTLKSTPSKDKSYLRKDLNKNLSQSESMTVYETEVQAKADSDAGNHLDCITLDGISVSSTPEKSKISNREVNVTFKSNNKSLTKNIIPMTDTTSDIINQSAVTISDDVISTSSKNRKSLRKEINMEKNLTRRKLHLVTTNNSEMQTESSSDVNNHLDYIISDCTLKSATAEISKISNRGAYIFTSESSNNSPVDIVIVSMNDNVSDNEDESGVIDSHDALESTPSQNKSLRKDFKNLSQRKSLLMLTNETERQSSDANNHLDCMTSPVLSTLKKCKNISNRDTNFVTLESSNNHSVRDVEVPMDDVSDVHDQSQVIESHDKLESSPSKNKSLKECSRTICSEKDNNLNLIDSKSNNKNNRENMHSDASNDSNSFKSNDAFDSHLYYSVELTSLRKSKTLKENSKAITPKQYNNRSNRHLHLNNSESNTESVDSGANKNTFNNDNQLTDVIPHSLESASFKKKKILSNLKTSGSISNKKNKQKISSSAQFICNSDGKTSTSEMCLQISDDQFPSSEQISNATGRSLINICSKSKSKESMKTSIRAKRNKNTTFQQSKGETVNKSLENNLSSNFISDKEIIDLKSQQNKTVTHETISKMPKSQSKKKTKTALSKNASENLIIQPMEFCYRRSTRSRVAPLEHWRNERRQFNRVTEKIVWEKGDEDFISERLKKKTDKNIKKNNKKTKLSDNTINVKHVQNILDTIAVINPDTGQEEDVYAHRPFKTLLWSSPQSQNSNDPSYQVTKCIAGDKISFGYIDIKKKKEKQYSPIYNIAFSVIKGKVKVTINKSKVMLEPLDVIIVPSCNIYSIDNIGSTNALLYFCTFMAPVFEYQVSRS